MKITQTWSEPDFRNGIYNIFLKWWDDNNEPHITVEKFIDFFYYPIDKLEELKEYIGNKSIEPFVSIDENTNQQNYESLFGDKLLKFKINKLKFKYGIISRNKKQTILQNTIKHNAFMLDISPELKYLNEHSDTIEWSQNRHLVLFDIETWYDVKNPESNKPKMAMQPVTSIQLYSSLSDEYYIISWHESFKNNKESVISEVQTGENGEILNLIKCTSELILFEVFIKLFKMLSPDVISGWYSGGYDVPYLINRASNLGLKETFATISPTNWVMCKYNSRKNNFFTTIKGVDHIDMMDAVAMLNIKMPTNKLDDIAVNLLGDDMSKIKASSWKDWKDDFEGFIKYGYRDVEILKKLDAKLQMFDLFYMIQDITNITKLSQKFQQTVLIDHFLISRYYNNTKKIFPADTLKEQVKYMGAYVKEPVVTGVQRNLGIFDYASLYPTTEMIMNLSPETFIISHTIAENNGLDIDRDILPELIKNNIKFSDTGYSDELVEKRYIFMSHKTKIGILPDSLFELYKDRKQFKHEMKKYDKDNVNYKVLDKRQYVFKIILNSSYGAMASKFFRLNNFRVADATTFYGRKLIRVAENYFQGQYKWTKMSKYLNSKYGEVKLPNFYRGITEGK